MQYLSWPPDRSPSALDWPPPPSPTALGDGADGVGDGGDVGGRGDFGRRDDRSE